MPRTDLALALFLAAVTALSRAPFRARILPSWDAVQFALALSEYDVVKHQPHPPGYILYVALTRLINAVIGDATASLTWLALAASAATVFLVYALAWRLYDRPTALVAATLLAASPLFWFYGVVGLSYTTEAALATVLALLIWRMREGQAPAALAAALALGIAGGVRQSVLVLFFPLWLGAAWATFRRWRAVLAGLSVLTLVTAAWLVPMVWLAGGPGPYAGAALELFDSTVRATSFLGAWPVNLVILVEAAVLGLGLLLPVLVPVVAAGLPRLGHGDPRAWFFAGWVVPPLLVYTFVHFGQYGYLLSILPGLTILIARWLVVATARLATAVRWRGLPGPVGRWAIPAGLVAGVVLAHAAFFTRAGSIEVPGLFDAAPGSEDRVTSLRARYRFRLWPHTARGLAEQEAVIRAYVDGVRRQFDPRDTVLVTELGNRRSYPWFRHVMYYLPEYSVYHLRLPPFSPGYLGSQNASTMAALDTPEILLPSSVRRIVWVVDYWNPAIPRPPELRALALPYGRWLYALPLERRVVEHGGYRLTPVTAVARLH
jgi:Dolichyl-phosphate-mannose-protein mannosyltransferase